MGPGFCVHLQGGPLCPPGLVSKVWKWAGENTEAGDVESGLLGGDVLPAPTRWASAAVLMAHTQGQALHVPLCLRGLHPWFPRTAGGTLGGCSGPAPTGSGSG